MNNRAGPSSLLGARPNILRRLEGCHVLNLLSSAWPDFGSDLSTATFQAGIGWHGRNFQPGTKFISLYQSSSSPIPHSARMFLVSGRISVLFDNKPCGELLRMEDVLHFWGSLCSLLSISKENCDSTKSSSRGALSRTGKEEHW